MQEPLKVRLKLSLLYAGKPPTTRRPMSMPFMVNFILCPFFFFENIVLQETRFQQEYNSTSL